MIDLQLFLFNQLLAYCIQSVLFLITHYQNLNKIMMIDSQNTTQQNKKTFVFENQLTKQSMIAYHKINTESKFTNIKTILDQYCPISTNYVQIFNTFTSNFCPLVSLNKASPFLVPTPYLEYGFIMFRFRPNISDHEHQQSAEIQFELSSDLSSNKKDRSKERTIGQVIELVKRWRKLHIGSQGKKINLQEAAKVVGISKKSLDDYYYQLRVGEQFDYDFQEHLNDKIGDLRAFVKSRKPQKSQKHRNIKHPKYLKIIEDNLNFEAIQSQKSERKSQNQFPSSNSPLLRNMQSQNERFFGDTSSLNLDKNLEIIENNYYGNFNLDNFLDQDNDPYFYTGDFRKKDSFNFDSNSDILF